VTQGPRRSGSGQLPSWFGLPFLAGGIIAAVFGFVLLQDELRYGREGVSVTGTVVETIYFSGGEDGPSYEARYEFVDPATGTRHGGQSDIDESTFDRMTAGDPIEVTYLPAEPTKSRVGSPEPQLLIPLALFGMAAIFIIVGVGLLLLTRRLRSHGAPSWLTVSSGSGGTWNASAASGSDDDADSNPLAAYFADDAAPAPAVPPVPMTEEELRALDARLAPREDKP
jgi:Protein of unknown function (DUF3592)